MNLYVETGLVAAYYTPDPLSADAEALLCAFAGPAVSDLTEVELFASLARKVRRAELGGEDAQRVRSLFLSHLEDGFFTRVTLRRGHYRLARDWAGRAGVPLGAAAALHLAAASLEGRTLATADGELIEAARELGVDVLPLGNDGEEALSVHEPPLALFG